MEKDSAVLNTPLNLKKKSTQASKDLRNGILFTLPATFGFFALTLIPMIASFILSFTDYGIFNTPKFIDFKNYIDLFTKDKVFFKVLGNTFSYTFLNVPVSIIFSLVIALILNSNIRFRNLFRSIFYIPTIVPAVATSMIWLWLMNPDFGLFNSALTSLGLPKALWLFSEKTVIPSIVLVGLWGTGGTMVIFLAGLQGIPRQYYEAIDVDGGNWFHKLMTITIPLLSPTIFFNTVMAIITSSQIFTQAFIMTGGGPNNASLFYVLYLYREGIQRSNMGYASALAWILFVIILAITLIIFRLQNKWVYYEGEKK